MSKEKSDFPLIKYLLWELSLPLVLCSIFTVVFSILELNYLYLPYSLDFTIQLSYNLAYYSYSASVYLICGIVSYAILSGKKKDKIWGIIIGTLIVAAIPFLMYLIKFLFFSSVYSYEDMMIFYDSDLTSFVSDGVKYLLFLIPVIIMTVYHRNKSIEFNLDKPYFSPIGSFQLICIIFYSAWFVASLLLFISKPSSERDVWGLIEELLRSVSGYFLTISGFLLFSHKNNKSVE